jgi:hypothetical protein
VRVAMSKIIGSTLYYDFWTKSAPMRSGSTPGATGRTCHITATSDVMKLGQRRGVQPISCTELQRVAQLHLWFFYKGEAP